MMNNQIITISLPVIATKAKEYWEKTPTGDETIIPTFLNFLEQTIDENKEKIQPILTFKQINLIETLPILLGYNYTIIESIELIKKIKQLFKIKHIILNNN